MEPPSASDPERSRLLRPSRSEGLGDAARTMFWKERAVEERFITPRTEPHREAFAGEGILEEAEAEMMEGGGEGEVAIVASDGQVR